MTHLLTSGAKWQYVEHLGLIQMFVYVFAIRNLILLIRPNSGLILKIRPNACHHLKNLCTLGLRPKFGLRTKSDLFYQVTHWMNCAYQTLFWYVLKCSLSAHWMQLVIFSLLIWITDCTHFLSENHLNRCDPNFWTVLIFKNRIRTNFRFSHTPSCGWFELLKHLFRML